MKMKDVAKKYAAKGFYVLPMDNKSKKPLIKFADQPPLTESDIDYYWDKFPHAQLALRTVDFFVIDIDVHGETDGFDSLRKYKHVSKLTETLTQTTGSGGRQMFYKKPKDIEVRQNIGWLTGVDIKAHINNYVMVAPSKIEGKPNAYKWDNRNPITELPEIVIKDINGEDTIAATDYSDFQVTGKNKTVKLFETIADGFGENGKRNDSLTKFVGALLFRNVGVKATKKLAYQANQNTAEPLPDDEFEKTFESVIKKEIRRRSNFERLRKSVRRDAESSSS